MPKLTYSPKHSTRRNQRRIGAVLLTLTALVTVSSAGSLLEAPPAEALAKIKCKQSTGTAHVDPILRHNQPVSDTQHEHQFFGSTYLLSMRNPNTANHADLASKGTTCTNTADTAAYWTPVLRYKSTGAMVPVRAFTAYYRSWDFQKTGGGVPLPDDVRLIASKHNWTCGQFEAVRPSQSIPNCSMADGRPGSTLTAHIDFPSCWDGVRPKHASTAVGDTKDNAHFAYRTGKTCPPGFPIKTVALRMTLQFAYTGMGTDLELSSDAMMGTTDGQSLHGDFWNTWAPGGLASMVRNCVAPGGRPTSAECG